MITFGSLFAGAGGFDLGFERAGMRALWNVEIDKNCRKLLAARFPHAAQFDDVRTVGKHNLAPVDVICGGFPCQDLSVAGKRAGLVGERSGLFYELTRITHELQPAFLIFENVSGLLSSNSGHDFLAVLTELDRIGYHGAWTSLDAQYWHVAQRRVRVFGCFARNDIGAARCAEILDLSESLCGNFEACREKRQAVAPTISARTKGGGGLGTDFDCDGGLIPSVSPALKARDYKGPSSDGHGDGAPLIPIAFSSKDHGADATTDLSPTLRACPHDGSHANGGGPPAIAFHPTQDPISSTDGSTHALGCGSKQGQASVAIAFKPSHFTRGKDGAPAEISPPLSADADKGDQEPIVFQPRYYTRDNKTGGAPSDKADITNCAKAGDLASVVAQPMSVRRLTPVECLRLMGWPDAHFDGLGFSDSTKYKMCGNGAVANVTEWIARRIVGTMPKCPHPDSD